MSKNEMVIRYSHFSPPTIKERGVPETTQFQDQVAFDTNNFIREFSEFIDFHIKASLKVVFDPSLEDQMTVGALKDSLTKLLLNKSQVMANQSIDGVLEDRLDQVAGVERINDIEDLNTAETLLEEMFFYTAQDRLKNLGVEE